MRKADIAEHALAKLRGALGNGTYRLHSRLPPERDLAGDLGVSRSTLRKALEVIEAEGLIRRYVGRGTFVGGMPPTRDLHQLSAQAGLSPQAMVEASLVLEPAIAARAALAARPADIAYLKQCLEKREATQDREAYEQWDITLHRAIAEATHNPLLIAVLDAMSHLRQQAEWRAYRKSTLRPQRRDESAAEHRAIVKAIERRNPQAAYEASRHHLNTFLEAPIATASVK
jgi:DNA-binding FadR family transcriptional regulator